MAKNPAYEKAVLDWLNLKCPNVTCQSCSANKWAVADIHLAIADANYVPGTPTNLAMQTGVSPIDPIIPVYCTNCGYARFYSAIVIGITPNLGSATTPP